MATAVVSARGRLVIPKTLRERYGFKPGTKIRFVEYGGVVALTAEVRDPIEATYGILKPLGGPALTDDIRAEHQREVEDEERYATEICA